MVSDPRPDDGKPCECPNCDCRLHLMANASVTVCRWCLRGEHGPGWNGDPAEPAKAAQEAHEATKSAFPSPRPQDCPVTANGDRVHVFVPGNKSCHCGAERQW